MADRILTWYLSTFISNSSSLNGKRMGPTYYMEDDYEPAAVRIYSDRVLTEKDAEVDIKDDGVSIFANRASTFTTSSALKGPIGRSDPSRTTAVLPSGDAAEVDAEDFNNNPIEKGSWVYCEVVEMYGAEDLTVHLELSRISERDEPEE